MDLISLISMLIGAMNYSQNHEAIKIQQQYNPVTVNASPIYNKVTHHWETNPNELVYRGGKWLHPKNGVTKLPLYGPGSKHYNKNK
jgi:hypothetical protein